MIRAKKHSRYHMLLLAAVMAVMAFFSFTNSGKVWAFENEVSDDVPVSQIEYTIEGESYNEEANLGISLILGETIEYISINIQWGFPFLNSVMITKNERISNISDVFEGIESSTVVFDKNTLLDVDLLNDFLFEAGDYFISFDLGPSGLKILKVTVIEAASDPEPEPESNEEQPGWQQSISDWLQSDSGVGALSLGAVIMIVFAIYLIFKK